jgi:tetratricopeptide (TPR) repeat protein
MIGFFIHRSLPNTKFKRAKKLYDSEDFAHARSIFNDIFDKHDKAPAYLAKCKLKLGQQASSKSERLKFFNGIIELRKRISNSDAISHYGSVEAKAFLEKARFQFSDASENIDELKENIRFIDSANQKGVEADFKKLKRKHFHKVATVYFNHSIQKEKDDNITDALETYLQAINYAQKSSNFGILANSYIRTAICNLKINNDFEKLDTSTIEKSKIEYQHEYYYKLAVLNIKKDNLSDAEKIISTHLDFKTTGFKKSETKLFGEIADLCFKNSIEREKKGDIAEALESYSKAITYAQKATNIDILANSYIRTAICNLKINNEFEKPDASTLEKSKIEYKHEYYYRLAILNIENDNFLDAEKIISTHLDSQSTAIESLRQILRTKQKNNAIVIIAGINRTIKKMYNTPTSINKAKSLYDNIDEFIKQIKPIDDRLAYKVLNIKPTLRSRLLLNYILNGKYVSAINLIQKFPEFWKNPELLKNFGICCHSIISEGLLNKNNYRLVISGWLIAIYSDEVILNSLEETSWDDNYTFTLTEAIGSNNLEHDSIPENVNFDDVSTNNISIGATQKELLQQFETCIHKKIEDASFSELVDDFYDEQKESLETIINFIDDDIFIATPFFAKKHSFNYLIIEALDNVYHNKANEEALRAGGSYLRNNYSSRVYEYSHAQDILVKLKAAIKNADISKIKTLNSDGNRILLSSYESLKSPLEDAIFNTLSKQIGANGEDRKLIPIMQECIQLSDNNENLKYQYSNYVTDYCIEKRSYHAINNYEALSLMSKAYVYGKNSPKLCKNIVASIKFNLMDILNDDTNQQDDIFAILDWITKNMSQTFKQNSGELYKARREILQKLEKSGEDLSLLKEDPSRDLVEPLVEHLFNAQGPETKRVLTYFRRLGHKSNSNIMPGTY